MKSILILLHCESNTGYAIAPLERTFFEMALRLVDGEVSRIHFAYPSMRNGPSPTMPPDFDQYVVIDSKSREADALRIAERYIRDNDIDTIFGFDQPVDLPIYRYFRRAGVKHFVSYWGAPMSSIFGPLRLAVKRLEVSLRRYGPDYYIFESNGMADTAVRGRGISRSRVTVIPLGIDVQRFSPNPDDRHYVYEQLAVAPGKRIFFYAGHMEPRKGVAVIMQAANLLAERAAVPDWHIVLFGNRSDDHLGYLESLTEEARKHVTFGGYRQDLERIQRGCYAAIIASTGWDSFPRSALEVQSSGLPLLVSNLPGLNETIADRRTGFLFPAGDSKALADAMQRLLTDPSAREEMSREARRRIESEYTSQVQMTRLVEVVRRVTSLVRSDTRRRFRFEAARSE